jgi:hypothetical protein
MMYRSTIGNKTKMSIERSNKLNILYFTVIITFINWKFFVLFIYLFELFI